MSTVDDENFGLPAWPDCCTAVAKGCASALQRFIHDNEPADLDGTVLFRQGLREALCEEAAASTIAGKYADVLLPFLRLMEIELHANSGKGDRPGWLSMSREVATLEIYHHVAKLAKAARDSDEARVREHAADVANMAMMLADVCGVLPK